jgi:hypothetical protein
MNLVPSYCDVEYFSTNILWKTILKHHYSFLVVSYMKFYFFKSILLSNIKVRFIDFIRGRLKY